MRKQLAVLISVLSLCGAATAAMGRGATIAVKGHITSKGTYVAPSVRTAPNATKTDNWSSKPNVNPYTGKPGTIDPLKPKAP